MKTQNLFMLLFAALLLVATSCEEKDKEVAPDKKAMLTAKTWKPSAIYADGQKVTKSGAPSLYSWTIKFDSDGTYVFETPNGDMTGTWEFNSSQTKISFDDGDNPWKITILESNKLTYEAPLILVDENEEEHTYDGEYQLVPAN